MVQPRLTHSLGIWVAWVLAGAVGSLLPSYLFNVLILPWIQARSLYTYAAVVGVVVFATCLAFFQYIVLRVLIGRVSLTITMWIPASVMAALVGFITPMMLLDPALSLLISISAIWASVPPDFPTIGEEFAVLGLGFATFVGLGQGIVLWIVYRRDVIGFWMLANLLAALVASTLLGIRYQWYANPDGVDALVSGVIYAAVTGPTLLFLAGRRLGGDTSIAQSPAA